MTDPTIALSNIVTAFEAQAIGTKVTDSAAFWAAVNAAVAVHDFNAERIPGQGFIMVPDAIPAVSAGVGKTVNDPNAYVVRSHRGAVHAYLKREHAAPVEGLAVVVYTLSAYLADPDIDETPGEAERIKALNPTHVLVAVLAFAGPKASLSPHRFVMNLAGGNHEASVWTADEIRERAREIAAYSNEWSTVAD